MTTLHHGPLARFDNHVDELFDHLRGRPWADRFFYTATELGDFSLIWHLGSVARGLRRGGDVAETMRISALMGMESAIVNGAVKSLFRRSRPITDVPRPFRLRQPRTSSFPSGHASAAAVFTVLASEDDSLAPLYAAIALVVATSRIHVRIHHASDVVGGLVVGTGLGFALRRAWPTGTLPQVRRRR